MRSSVLSRSVIAVASLAIGSAVFVAAPATAATANGITREDVLAAASSLRADPEDGSPQNGTPELAALAAKACGPLGSDTFGVFGQPVATPDSVDGLTVTVLRQSAEDVEGPTGFPFGNLDTCTFAAVAPLGSGTTFTGDLEVTTSTVRLTDFPFGQGTTSTVTSRLSGDVFVSPVTQATSSFSFAGAEANGLVTAPNGQRVLTVTKIADKKSKAAKKAAKRTYVKRIKAAKKSYAKAVKRAHGSPTKKAVARAAYLSRRSAVKSSYSYAIADYKLVKTRSAAADARRFSVSTGPSIVG
ncbi:hypothetical protein AERO_00440 [Aeromicrobium fastidiosum]|uniref:hypothetical protein n=1 Tax=Aeromicrobium TaxID=2040 RepID=UPI001783779D|nr:MULTISPECIES: hypothetical protein [Aeromicrobium]MBD8608495.1 hypothetical protein [Aeromicrobium sp. CFBP 8757]MCL8249836.1 hypothetical protein [Aeromicrobium fastidiosum]